MTVFSSRFVYVSQSCQRKFREKCQINSFLFSPCWKDSVRFSSKKLVKACIFRSVCVFYHSSAGGLFIRITCKGVFSSKKEKEATCLHVKEGHSYLYWHAIIISFNAWALFCLLPLRVMKRSQEVARCTISHDFFGLRYLLRWYIKGDRAQIDLLVRLNTRQDKKDAWNINEVTLLALQNKALLHVKTWWCNSISLSLFWSENHLSMCVYRERLLLLRLLCNSEIWGFLQWRRRRPRVGEEHADFVVTADSKRRQMHTHIHNDYYNDLRELVCTIPSSGTTSISGGERAMLCDMYIMTSSQCRHCFGYWLKTQQKQRPHNTNRSI